jgi:DNA-directed RNA polymerase specialized sigma24 family protein
MIQPGETGMPAPSGQAWFATTHWSVVLAAGKSADAPASAALEQLCRTYWYPLYAFIRRQSYSPEDAQDLTQGFFEHVFEHQTLDRVQREKGRFRSFLLASLKYYVADQRAHEQRQKRGGGQRHFSLDALTAEERYRLEPKDNRTPEQLFERRWVQALLDRVLARLRAEYASSNQIALFEALEPFLVAKEGGDSYAAVAARFQRSEAAIQKAVQRMRRRYQELTREEIAQTVSTPEEGEDELRHFSDIMGSG